jgi:ATP-dependent Lon protease
MDDAIWPLIVRPLGYDMGIRTLQRTLEGAVRKSARIIVEKGYPEVIITMENRKIFLPQY